MLPVLFVARSAVVSGAVLSVGSFAGSAGQQSVVGQSAVERFESFVTGLSVVVLSVLIVVGSFELFGNVPNKPTKTKLSQLSAPL